MKCGQAALFSEPEALQRLDELGGLAAELQADLRTGGGGLWDMDAVALRVRFSSIL